MRLSMKMVAQLIGVDIGEWIALKGRGHNSSVHNGNDFKYVITEAGFQRALWEADKKHAVRSGDMRHCPIAHHEFHALCCGMLVVVRADVKHRQYVLGYGPDQANAQKSVLQSLF